MKVCVFCSARNGTSPVYMETARELGSEIAKRSIELVYGGASVGTMGALADAALLGGGVVHGVIPSHLEDREVSHRGLSRLEIVPDMAVRKDRMIAIADAFIALPGGLGTLDELLEVATGRQLDLHRKNFDVLDVDGFFDPFFALLNKLVEAGFVRGEERDLFFRAGSPADALDLLSQKT